MQEPAVAVQPRSSHAGLGRGCKDQVTVRVGTEPVYQPKKVSSVLSAGSDAATTFPAATLRIVKIRFGGARSGASQFIQIEAVFLNWQGMCVLLSRYWRYARQYDRLLADRCKRCHIS